MGFYGIGFDKRSSYNKKKDISILGKGRTQGLEHTLTAEKMYAINLTVTKKEILLKLTL